MRHFRCCYILLRATFALLVLVGAGGCRSARSSEALTPVPTPPASDIIELAPTQAEAPATVSATHTEEPVASVPLPPPTSLDVSTYRVAPHDVLRIAVHGEPDISIDYPVSASGEISHPFLGQVQIQGMTVEQVTALLTERLDRDFIVNPKVTISVVNSAGRRFIVFGQVQKPGVHHVPPNQPMTLLRAIATAGGFTPLASTSRVRIVRRALEGDHVIHVDVSSILSGRGDARDVPLEPDDVITVPESFF